MFAVTTTGPMGGFAGGDPGRMNINTLDDPWIFHALRGHGSTRKGISIAPLIFDADNLGGGIPEPSGGNQADFDSLIDLITSTVTPNSWDSSGSAGSIAPFSTNLTLVVSQTQEIHENYEDPSDYPEGLDGLNFDQIRVPQGSKYIENVGASDVPLISDVARLYGMNQGTKYPVQTDPFALQMSFNPDALLTESMAFHDKRINDSIRLDSGDEGAASVQMSFRTRRGFDSMLGSIGPDYPNWLNTLLPPLAGRPAKPRAAIKEPKKWSPEAIALSKSLSRLESLQKLTGGIEINAVTNRFDLIWHSGSTSPTGERTSTLFTRRQHGLPGRAILTARRSSTIATRKNGARSRFRFCSAKPGRRSNAT